MRKCTTHIRLFHLATLLIVGNTMLAVSARAGSPNGSAQAPISGFQPQVAFGLTNEQGSELDFLQTNSSSPGGSSLPLSGAARYEVGLFDTGAGIHVLRDEATDRLGIKAAGLGGTQPFTIGGVGEFQANIEDPLGIYAAGLGAVTATNPLSVNRSKLIGATNVSVATAPPDSALPNVIGLPLAGQYTTVIRNDRPMMISIDGKTVRSPDIELLPLGSGNAPAITRQAPMQLLPGESFLIPPIYMFNFDNALTGQSFSDNPTQPTAVAGGMFLSVDLEHNGEDQNNLVALFDTGATSTVVSDLVAINLGIDPTLDTPDFRVPVGGAGATRLDVPGFIIDSLNIDTRGGDFTLENVPVIVLNLPNPTNPANILPALIGTNLFNDRNLVVNPKPGSSYLAISDPVLEEHRWSTVAASGLWATPSNWDEPGQLSPLWSAHLIHNNGTAQAAVVSSDATVHQMYVAGETGSMTVQVNSSALTVFGIIQIAAGGHIRLQAGTVSALSLELNGGTLSGQGHVAGEIINAGIVAPGNSAGELHISKDYVQTASGTLEIEIGGLEAETQYDQLWVNGTAALNGTLDVSFLPGLSAAQDSTFDVLMAEQFVGSFDQIIVPLNDLGDPTLGMSVVSANGIEHLRFTALEALEVLALIKGDVNSDGKVDNLDITPFIAAVAADNDAAAFLAQVPGGHFLAADVNTDGAVNNIDITPFISQLSGATAPLPEPSTLALVLTAWILVTKRRLKAGSTGHRQFQLGSRPRASSNRA